MWFVMQNLFHYELNLAWQMTSWLDTCFSGTSRRVLRHLECILSTSRIYLCPLTLVITINFINWWYIVSLSRFVNHWYDICYLVCKVDFGIWISGTWFASISSVRPWRNVVNLLNKWDSSCKTCLVMNLILLGKWQVGQKFDRPLALPVASYDPLVIF